MNTKTINLNIDNNSTTNKIIAMQPLWISRSKDYPFYTLGRCAYLDGKTTAYYKDSAWQNEILIGEFESLYEELLNKLSIIFQEPVELAHDLAIPGFHIFLSHPKFLKISGKWHQDYPHITLGLDDVDSYAFTVAIKLPISGGGVDYIDEFHQPQRYEYTENKLMVHNGLTIHRIASLNQYKPEEYRITLQGHIVRRNGLLEAFF